MASIHFLLVDDEKLFIETVAHRLRQREHTVDCAFSGMEALSLLENDRSVDIVILDMRMPDLDGLKTLEAIKTAHPLVEVIMLTGHATVPSAIESMKSGAFDYITKPCELQDLLSKAKQAVSRKKDREAKIRDVRSRPCISDRERKKLIDDIMKS